MSLHEEALEAKQRYGFGVTLFIDEKKNPWICGEGWNWIEEQTWLQVGEA